MASNILDVLTLFVALVVLCINIFFSKKENTRRFLIENVIHQRNADMLELRKQTAQFSVWSDRKIVEKNFDNNDYLEQLIHCSKILNHVLKREYREDRKVLAIKDSIVVKIKEFFVTNDIGLLDEIEQMNLIFGRISELYVFCAWQCIKMQGTGENILGSKDFSELFSRYQNSYLTAEDLAYFASIY